MFDRYRWTSSTTRRRRDDVAVGDAWGGGARAGLDAGTRARRRRRALVVAPAADARSRGMSEKLDKAWARLSGEKELNAENVKAPLKDVRRALLEADVSLPVAVRRFIKRCEDKVAGTKVTKGGRAGANVGEVRGG